MKLFILETAGIKSVFNPKTLTIETYVYEEFDSTYKATDIKELREKYRELLSQGYSSFDPNEIVGTKPILETTLEQDAMRNAEIKAMEDDEFFTAKPDDWAHK